MATMPCSLLKQYDAGALNYFFAELAFSNLTHSGLQNDICCQTARQK
jgi:hypothetical protein